MRLASKRFSRPYLFIFITLLLLVVVVLLIGHKKDIGIFGAITKAFNSKEHEYLHDLNSNNTISINRAAYMLGQENVTKAVPQLISILKEKDCPLETKKIIIQSLGKLKDKRAEQVLLNNLQKGPYQVRVSACAALGMIQSTKSVDSLIQIATNQNEDQQIRLTAIWSLDNIGDLQSISALNSLLSSNNTYIRYNASKALLNIKSKS